MTYNVLNGTCVSLRYSAHSLSLLLLLLLLLYNGSCEELASKSLLVSAHMTALLTLLLLALDHYLAICHPLHHRSDLFISMVNVTIVVIWIASLSCSALEFLLPVNSLSFL